jgi:hypothetical protein
MTTHQQKIKIARGFSPNRLEKGTGIFSTEAWKHRKKAIAERVKRLQDFLHQKALAKKEARKKAL